MTIADWSNCAADRIGITVDTIQHEADNWGEQNLRDFLNWYRGLGEADRSLVNVLLGLGGGAIVTLVTKALGAAGAEIAVGMLGLATGTAVGALIMSMAMCVDKL